MEEPTTVTWHDLERRFNDCTSEDDLLRVIGEIQQLKASVVVQLDHTVSSGQVSLHRALEKVELSQSQLSPALNMSHDLSKMLASASHVASRISSRVRAIDAEHVRVKDSLAYVEDIILLKSCVLGIQDAMDTRDWERAASYVHKANSLPKDLIDGEFAKATVPTSEVPDYPSDTIQKASASLGQLFIKQFNKATSTKDMENVTRYFKLFPLIGQENEGLDLYAKFISSIITAHSRTLLQHRTSKEPGSGTDMFYGLAMSRLFENIALIVSQHAPVVERHYGQGRMMRVLAKIQDEADSQGGLIIDTFWDERRVDRILAEVSSYPFGYLVNSFVSRPGDRTASPDFNSSRNSEDEGTMSLKEIGALVQESSVMLHRWALYRKFLALRWDSYAPALGAEQQEETEYVSHGLTIPPVVKDCGFSVKVEHRLAPGFEALATFVLRRSVEKAFQLEELPDIYQIYTTETPLISSVVDDVMYIYSTLLQQTIVLGDLAIIKTVFANFRRIFESDFIGMVQRKLRDKSPKQGMVPTSSRSVTPVGGGRVRTGNGPQTKPLAGLGESDDRRLRIFLIYLNDLCVTPSYAERIFKSLSIDADVPFNDDAATVRDILASLSNGLKSRCVELLNDGISVVFYTTLNNRLRSLCTGMFNKTNYMLTPDHDGDKESSRNDLSQSFSYGWHSLVGEFARTMSPENYTKLLTIAAQSLSQILEKWIWGLERKVNELGAISLDRDISRIIATVSEGRYQLREKFVRVAQIVMVVGFDETDDRDDQDITWSLTYDEQVKASRIRI